MERGDIYLVSLDLTSGHEQQGTRPVLVVSASAFNRLTKAPVVLPILLDPMRRMGSRTRLRRSPKLTKSNQDATHLTRVTMRRMVTRKNKLLHHADFQAQTAGRSVLAESGNGR